ncbi:MAG: hypothetical protein M1820_001000 [Bogoriella megaspora]|nr:MAG: hypothetical protein M1820_001000 [Bogoriella megaspora]
MATPSARLNVNDLPLETLQVIADHLHETHRPSFYEFGLASKTCHSATIASMFREIHLTVRDPKTLQHNADTLIEALSSTDSARHVRCLSIKGFLRLRPEVPDEPRAEAHTMDDMTWFEETGVDEILAGEEPIFPTSGSHVSHGEAIIERSSEEDMAWAPVVSLIERLPGLTTLVYDCRNQFPPSLLDAVHEHPLCKLKHLTFRLRSLLRDVPDPYEMALATSPCLYSVQVRCAWRDSNGDDDFNQEAMMELVAGLAPNPKEVIVVNVSPYMRSAQRRRPRGQWRGLPGFNRSSSKGSLTSLSLLGSVDWWTPDVIRAWAEHTDFGSLRHLALGGGHTLTSERGMCEVVLGWIVQNCSFPQLKTLRVHLGRDDMIVERLGYPDAAVAFFKTFEPLEELIVSGPLDLKILDAILSQHGPTLQKLSLRPTEGETSVENGRIRSEVPMVFEKEHLLLIQAQCPALRELAIPVKRTQSNAIEAEIYRTFGKMECLEILFLTLDCSDWRVSRDSTRRDEPSFDEFDREIVYDLDFLQKGHVRETFMNCAVDETLARSIWDVICQAKLGKPLQSLKLWTHGGDQWGNGTSNGGIGPIVDKLSRSWLIERDVGNDNGIITVKELSRRGREIRDQKEAAIQATRLKKFGAEANVERGWGVFRQIFHRIWPPKEGSKNWREDWKSLPLQV